MLVVVVKTMFDTPNWTDLVTIMMLWTLLILAECSMHVTYMYDPSSGLQHKSPFSVAQ